MFSGVAGRMFENAKPTAIIGMATATPASGPAAPISNNARFERNGERILMTAPNVPIKIGMPGMKYGSVTSTPYFRAAK